MIIWIFPVYEVTDKIFQANKYRKITQSKELELIINESNVLKNPDVEENSLRSVTENANRIDLDSTSENNISSAPEIVSSEYPSASLGQKSSEPISDQPVTISFVSTNSSVPPSDNNTSVPASDNNSSVPPSDNNANNENSVNNNQEIPSVSEAAPSSLPPSSPSVSATTPESESGNSVLDNIKFWILTTIGRLCAIAIIAIPSFTPVKEKFGLNYYYLFYFFFFNNTK
jgi:hypothetical protein